MIYTLTNGNYTAQVNSTGAELFSLKGPDGFEYIWTGDPDYWTGHAPVLFPMVGWLRGGKAKLDGKWVKMGRHGFARRSEFSLAEEGEGKLSLRLVSNEETKKCYPYDFALTVTYTLEENGYKTAFTVENTGDRPMPFTIGGHPGFAFPLTRKLPLRTMSSVLKKKRPSAAPVLWEKACWIIPRSIWNCKASGRSPCAMNCSIGMLWSLKNCSPPRLLW